MPNEENVDTSGLSFTNCIQNRFFFSFSSSPPPCKLTFGLKLWPKNVLSREEYVVSRQAMNLVPCFIFSLPRETLSLSSLKKKKFDTTSALQRLLSTMLKFCMIKTYDLASFYFLKKKYFKLGLLGGDFQAHNYAKCCSCTISSFFETLVATAIFTTEYNLSKGKGRKSQFSGT